MKTLDSYMCYVGNVAQKGPTCGKLPLRLVRNCDLGENEHMRPTRRVQLPRVIDFDIFMWR